MKFIGILLIVFSSVVSADGIVVDKVYQPYVLPNEIEFEWRLLSRQTEKGNVLGQRIAFGKALNEQLMAEIYLVGEETNVESFALQAYEIELRWMLTEQGEMWADWGMLFELEKRHRSEDWEFTTGLLFEKELGATSLTLNAFTVYEWGKNQKNELEAEFRLKYRYRLMAELQPAIEIYTGESFIGVGPAFMGIIRIDRNRQFKWEAGFITEIKNPVKDHSFRLALEYEF
ncbi:hypothetical protein [Catenovulum maritimum]|uniref:Copper resistance protein CopB n=1 Tax=Catenovulum maritimum TaxID=1513271 RepID=A0A0J8JPV2_9ALTE|nr:hypothetical protein [Catenovulum maritimum]KMT66711.1 hypothetical protein XM47_00860 [Catenovulum maritimum]